MGKEFTSATAAAKSLQCAGCQSTYRHPIFVSGVLSCLFVTDSVTPLTVPHQAPPPPWDLAGKNTGVDYHFPSPGDLPNPWIEPGSPTLQADSFLSEPPGKPKPGDNLLLQ